MIFQQQAAGKQEDCCDAQGEYCRPVDGGVVDVDDVEIVAGENGVNGDEQRVKRGWSFEVSDQLNCSWHKN